MERDADNTTVPELPELGGTPDASAALGALDAAASALPAPPAPPGLNADTEPARRGPGRPRRDGTPAQRRKPSGAENRRRKRERAADDGATLTPADMVPPEPPQPSDEELAAAKRAERVALLASDPAAAENLRDQIGALLQLAFTGTGYAAAMVLNTSGSIGMKTWELTETEERNLSQLFVRAHGADLMEQLEGGIITKTLAWGMLAKVIGDKTVAHRQIAGKR